MNLDRKIPSTFFHKIDFINTNARKKEEIFNIRSGPVGFGAIVPPNVMWPLHQAEIHQRLLLTCRKACCPTYVLHCWLATCRSVRECISLWRPHTMRPTGLHSKNELGPMQAERNITVALWSGMSWGRTKQDTVNQLMELVLTVSLLISKSSVWSYLKNVFEKRVARRIFGRREREINKENGENYMISSFVNILIIVCGRTKCDFSDRNSTQNARGQ